MAEKARAKVEILTEFLFDVCFLDVISTLDVRVYAYRVEITSSASKSDSPVSILLILKENLC